MSPVQDRIVTENMRIIESVIYHNLNGNICKEFNGSDKIPLFSPGKPKHTGTRRKEEALLPGQKKGLYVQVYGHRSPQLQSRLPVPGSAGEFPGMDWVCPVRIGSFRY